MEKYNYRIYMTPGKSKLKNNDMIRIDLYGSCTIKDVNELKGFNFIYITKGHTDKTQLHGKEVERKVRYLKIFKKDKSSYNRLN